MAAMLLAADGLTPKNPIMPGQHMLWGPLIFGLVLLGLVVGGVLLLVRLFNRPAVASGSGAEGVLAERFARGEIDEAESRQRRKAVRE